jgi:hypothetical protein
MSKGWLIAGLALAGCSQAPQESQEASPEVSQYDVASSADGTGASPAARMAAPGINITAAPGVAFTYRYAFSLAADRISAAQEAHAAACEKLTVARCRIVGMRYDLAGEDRVTAQLAFKLDPTLACAFGREGIAAIERADGTLVSAAITGTDAGATIDAATQTRGRAEEDLARIDRELARANLRPTERAELQRQRTEITARIEGARSSADQARQSLANTPMTFDYRSGPAIRGFDPGAPLKSALSTLLGSAEVTLAVALGLLALLGPPALLFGLILLAWRRFAPKRAPRPAPQSPLPTPAGEPGPARVREGPPAA